MIAITVPDIRGYVPDLTKIGSTWIHSKTRTKYIITGFEFDAERDVWVYQYRDYGKTMLSLDASFTRSPENFHEFVEKVGSERFFKADVEG